MIWKLRSSENKYKAMKGREIITIVLADKARPKINPDNNNLRLNKLSKLQKRKKIGITSSWPWIKLIYIKTGENQYNQSNFFDDLPFSQELKIANTPRSAINNGSLNKKYLSWSDINSRSIKISAMKIGAERR